MAASVRIALLADIHHGPDLPTKRGSAALPLLERFAGFVRESAPDLVLELGGEAVLRVVGADPFGCSLPFAGTRRRWRAPLPPLGPAGSTTGGVAADPQPRVAAADRA